MSHDHVVVGFFNDKSAARKAADALKDWDKGRKDVKLGACGVIVEKNGKLEKSGRRFVSDDVTVSIIDRIVSRVDRRIDKWRELRPCLGIRLGIGLELTGEGIGRFVHCSRPGYSKVATSTLPPWSTDPRFIPSVL